MGFKFEKLDVWNLSLEYSDLIYALAEKLPGHEKFNLRSQITRSATSISLNIAEGSTGQSNQEQNRFLGMAVSSLIETIACLRIITRRNYIPENAFLERIDLKAQELAKRLFAFRKTLTPSKKSIGEEQPTYDTDILD